MYTFIQSPHIPLGVGGTFKKQDISLFFKFSELKKEKTFEVVKFILYIIPIFFLSKRIYLHFNISDTTSFYWDGFASFFLQENGIWWIVYFCFIYFISYSIEKYIVPSLLINLKPIKAPSKINETLEEYELIREYKYNGAKDFINKSYQNKIDFFASTTSLPVFITLWLCFFDNIVCYFFMIIIWLVFIFLVKTYIFISQ